MCSLSLEVGAELCFWYKTHQVVSIWDQVGTPISFLPFNLIIIMIFISFQRTFFKLGWRRMKAFKLRYYFAIRKVPGRLLHLYSLKPLTYIEAFRYVFKAPIRKTCELSRQISSNSFVLNVLLRKKSCLDSSKTYLQPILAGRWVLVQLYYQRRSSLHNLDDRRVRNSQCDLKIQ